MLLVAIVRCSLFDPHQHGVRYVGLLRAFKNMTLEVFLGDIYPLVYGMSRTRLGEEDGPSWLQDEYRPANAAILGRNLGWPGGPSLPRPSAV